MAHKLYNYHQMNSFEKELAFAMSVARHAGTIMRAYYRTSEKQTAFKADKSPVTAADREINEYLITAVAATFPTHGVLGEEASTMTAEHSDVWVCDPIDGTIPFILGVPTAMFSLAFVRDGVPVLGVAFDPFLDRMFHAVKGYGAMCNDDAIVVGTRSLTEGAVIAGPSYVQGLLRSQSLYESLRAEGAAIAMFPGNVYKCTLIADGHLDGRIFGGPYAHDIAAIKIIVEEAGGRVTDLDGNEQRYDGRIRGAIISNGTIHQDLIDAVAAFGGAQKVMDV